MLQILLVHSATRGHTGENWTCVLLLPLVRVVHRVIRREGPHVVTWGGALGMHVAVSHTTQFRYIS